ncbi:MAG: hypothetical protein NVS3B5_11170 [Sphingomicrobium sp.]
MRPALPHLGVPTRIGRSDIHGVGVFAICAIEEGTQLFAHDDAEISWIDFASVDEAGPGPAERALYTDFAIRRDGKLGCPISFDLLTPGWYVNQPRDGEAANLRATHDLRMIAARDLAAGEELTICYSAFNSGPAWE